MVATPLAVKGAYQKPDATESPRMATSIPIFTGGGFIPSLLGSAIDAAMVAKQQRKYEKANAELFPALAKAMGPPPLVRVKYAFKQTLVQHYFFGPRLATKSGASFVTEIQKYGLQKVPGYKGADVPLRVRIIVHVALKLPDGRALWEGQFTGTSSNALMAQEILDDPDFMKNGIDEAAQDLCTQISSRLDEKLAKRGNLATISSRR